MEVSAGKNFAVIVKFDIQRLFGFQGPFNCPTVLIKKGPPLIFIPHPSHSSEPPTVSPSRALSSSALRLPRAPSRALRHHQLSPRSPALSRACVIRALSLRCRRALIPAAAEPKATHCRCYLYPEPTVEPRSPASLRGQ